MRCKGTTKKGTQCRKKADDGYCANHEDQRVEDVEKVEEVEEVEEEQEVREPCARCGPEKESIQDVQVGPEIKVPLCMSCSIALLRTVFEFTGIEDIDAKLLEFRESF